MVMNLFMKGKYMLKKSIHMQISYLLRSKPVIFILFILLAVISINFGINLNANREAMYISEMYSFEKMLTLSDWSKMGYYLVQYYPLLIVIPTACSYIIDRNNGINTYVQSRVGKRSYWYGKLISVFVLTLLIFTLPFLMEIILNLICFPLEANGHPSGEEFWMTIEEESQYFLSDILLYSGALYAVIMVLLFGVVSAVLATFNFAVTTLPIFKIKILTYFPIYILFFAISILPHIINLNFTVDYYYILRMFETTTVKNYGAYSAFMIVLLAVSVILIEWKIKKEEVL